MFLARREDHVFSPEKCLAEKNICTCRCALEKEEGDFYGIL
jgi:hypothetical protein